MNRRNLIKRFAAAAIVGLSGAGLLARPEEGKKYATGSLVTDLPLIIMPRSQRILCQEVDIRPLTLGVLGERRETKIIEYENYAAYEAAQDGRDFVAEGIMQIAIPDFVNDV